VKLIRPVDRYPDFIAPLGATGTVVENTGDFISVKLDAPLAGAEEWDNCVMWGADCLETLADFAEDVCVLTHD
jgi:hypothetical protein